MDTKFKALLYPFGNYICLLFMAGILVIMAITPGMAISVWLIPVWILILASVTGLKTSKAGSPLTRKHY